MHFFVNEPQVRFEAAHTVGSTEQSAQRPGGLGLQTHKLPVQVPPCGEQGVTQSASVWHCRATHVSWTQT